MGLDSHHIPPKSVGSARQAALSRPPACPNNPNRFPGDSNSFRGRSFCSLWDIRGFHPDPRQYDARHCAVLNLLGLRRPVYLGFQRLSGSYEEFEQRLQLNGLKPEMVGRSEPVGYRVVLILSMGIEIGSVLGAGSVRVRALPRGGSGRSEMVRRFPPPVDVALLNLMRAAD